MNQNPPSPQLSPIQTYEKLRKKSEIFTEKIRETRIVEKLAGLLTLEEKK